MKLERLLLPDGRQVAFRSWGCGPPLVLLHGWSLCSTVFGEVAPPLGREFRVLAPDLRGHGGSSPGPGYSLEAMAGDLVAWVDALALPTVRLAGWSLGGQVALELCRRLGRRVERLVLIGTTPRFTADGEWTAGLPLARLRAMERNLRRRFEQTLEEFFELMFAGESLLPGRFLELSGLAGPGAHPPAREAALGGLETLGEVDLREHLQEVDLPVLVVQGREDRIVPAAAGEYLAARLPRAAGLFLDGVGHAPILSRPGEMVECWREFL